MSAPGPPDFIGVGALLSGTGWWYERLLEHPAIQPPTTGPEPLHFFERFCTEPMGDDDVARYHAHFPREPGTIRGEFTSRYLYDAWTLPLLRRAAPDAKLLVSVRDPIERYLSALSYRIAETESDEDAPYMTDAVHRGRYASQLRALLAFFPREQVLVLQYERFRLQPLEEYRRTLRFLGVDASFVPRRYKRLARGKTGPILPVRVLRALGVPETVNLRRFRGRRDGPPRAELWPDLEAALHDALDEEVAALKAELVPDLDLSLWPNFAHLAQEAT
ncbi:MAG: sulfotransferase domain-containing protein [Actinomycetota bacterium]|nr:sulfotransferase domain-containing protein [Actinomycetota bacterium]